MDSLILAATEDTPEVNFVPEKNIFSFSNVSLPEDAIEFYQPIFNWLKEYTENPNPTTNFDFSVEYINTASSKQIFDMMLLINKMANKSDITIRWHYDVLDEDMLMLGTRYKNLLKVKFELVEYSNDED